MSVELKGFSELAARFEEIADLEGARKAIKAACLIVEGDAKDLAPKGKTGELKGSIQHEVDRTGDIVTGIVYTNKDYAPYVEYGTGLFAEGGNGRKDVPWRYKDEKGDWHSSSGQEPHPFMRPALLANRQKIINLLKEGCIDG